MKKIVEVKTERIYPVDNGFIYAAVKKDSSKIKFFRYDMRLEISVPIRQSVYMEKKFANNPLVTVYEFSDYLNCDCAAFSSGNTAVLFHDGDIGWFGADGQLLKTGQLLHKGAPGRCILPDGADAFWSVIPDEGAVIQYSVTNGRMIIRIGGGEKSPFEHPSNVSKYDDSLYVCDDKNAKIQRVNLSDYRVSIHRQFDEPVYQYLRIGNSEIVCLESGIYILR